MAQTKAGAAKAAARRAGLTLVEYEALVACGQKWCTGCKDFHPRTAFGSDGSRSDGLAASCLDSRRLRYQRSYVSRATGARRGPAPFAPRAGDRRQARQRINVEVRTGHRPHPNTLSCVDCGHDWRPGERRHEYDHYLGYDAEHHYDVEPVCTRCHARRSRERGEIQQTRGGRGRYSTHEG